MAGANKQWVIATVLAGAPAEDYPPSRTVYAWKGTSTVILAVLGNERAFPNQGIRIPSEQGLQSLL